MPFALEIVTVLSLLITIGMGSVMWRLVREERRRSAARLAALAVELGEQRSALVEPPTISTGLFGSRFEQTAGRTRRLAGFGAAGVIVVAVVVSIVLLFPIRRQTEIVPDAPHLPVELLALADEHRDGMLAISGTVRNPRNGLTEQSLAVMALALDDNGHVVGTGRAPIDQDGLTAGTESTFAVWLPAAEATRYRISFLSEDTTVPHLDRRATRADATGPTGS